MKVQYRIYKVNISENGDDFVHARLMLNKVLGANAMTGNPFDSPESAIDELKRLQKMNMIGAGEFAVIPIYVIEPD